MTRLNGRFRIHEFEIFGEIIDNCFSKTSKLYHFWFGSLIRDSITKTL
jgi:hypothetical protein